MAVHRAAKVLLCLLLSGLCAADKSGIGGSRPSTRFVPPPPSGGGSRALPSPRVADAGGGTGASIQSSDARSSAPPRADDCMPFASVPGLVGRIMAGESLTTCSFSDGSIGVSAGQTPPPPSVTGAPLPARESPAPLMLPVGAGLQLAPAVRRLDAMVRLEKELSASSSRLRGPDQLQALHFRSDADTQHRGRRALRDIFVVQLAKNNSDAARAAVEAEATTTTIRETFEDGKKMRVMVRTKMVGEQLVPGCEPEPQIRCDTAAKYRSADGTCNNLQVPTLGRSGTGLHRLLNSTYADGVFSPRLLDSRGRPLPSARALSAALLPTSSSPDTRVAVSLPVFAEFLSHDLQKTSVFRLPDDQPIDCCASDSHPQCLPIAVAADDPVFRGRRCLSLTRSLPAMERQCLPRPAAPLSVQTAFLDGSGLYGATEEATRRLRELDGGRMKGNGDLLPPRDSPRDSSGIFADTGDAARRRRDQFGGPGPGFPPPGGLFPRQLFGDQFGGPQPSLFPQPFGPFGGPFGVPAAGPQDGRFGSFDVGLPNFPLQPGQAPTSRMSFSNEFMSIGSEVQHPTPGHSLGKKMDAFVVRIPFTAHNRDSNEHTHNKYPYPSIENQDHGKEDPASDRSDSYASEPSQPSASYGAPKASTRYGAPKASTHYGARKGSQHSDHPDSHPPKDYHHADHPDFHPPKSYHRQSIHSDSHPPKGSHYHPDSHPPKGSHHHPDSHPPKGSHQHPDSHPPKGNRYTHHPDSHPYADNCNSYHPGSHPPQGNRYTHHPDSRPHTGNCHSHHPDSHPTKGSRHRSRHPDSKSKFSADTRSELFPGFDEEFDHQFPSERSSFDSPFLGRIVSDDPDRPPGGFPASQPLSSAPERASADDVEEFLPSRTFAEDIASGGVSSRLQAPRPAQSQEFEPALIDLDLNRVNNEVDRFSASTADDDTSTRQNPLFSSLSISPLPLPTDQSCDAGCRDCTCFDAGNHRANEQPHGTLLHTVFLHEHNRVAAALSASHPDWDDERLFQEARRVVVAQLQHITYNEYLPASLGYSYAATRGLLPLSMGFSPLYLARTNPRPAVEFSTAAFRASHSKLQAMLRLVSRQGQVDNSKLSDGIFKPSQLVNSEFFVRLARGMIDQPAESTDANFDSAVHGEMFDLPTLTIQRGRDQGLATYPAAVQLCHGTSLVSWDDFSQFMDSQAVESLRREYASPADVDLYVGGLLERHAEGADVGPTFQCLVGDMFHRLRMGDRYFYDLQDQPGSFSSDQLKELRKTSLARLLCDNVGGDFDGVQAMAMLRPDERENPIVACTSEALPKVDLSVF